MIQPLIRINNANQGLKNQINKCSNYFPNTCTANTLVDLTLVLMIKKEVGFA